jgi:ubiquinol-cytochrome c reductase cytochrome c1 subunit
MEINIMKNKIAKILSSIFMCGSLILGFAFTYTNANANESSYPLEKSPKSVSDLAALQHGAKIFVNYCLNCHSASAMRYNRLKDIGLSDDDIKNNLLFTADKVGETMQIAMRPKDAKQWFGASPPDLSVVARSRGTDWIYTYMRSFYVDKTRATGWNNALFHNVGMPHVLWELQGPRKLKEIEEVDPHDHTKKITKIVGFEQISDGKMKPLEYDNAIADLTVFLEWMSEPSQNNRKKMGAWILAYLAIFTLLAWLLNKNYWKDIK